ncbi:hypothetical protein L6Q21_04885 [Sandaracinobacter sp. RS1-74]|nr:hypothetical protein [Sandaracinobacteroides sayramensis]MCG2840316.1 hypothetical protein [Sandaracinobacteroides sayramensis]
MERQAIDPGEVQSLEEAFERNRAAALEMMDRLGLTPAIQGDNRQA